VLGTRKKAEGRGQAKQGVALLIEGGNEKPMTQEGKRGGREPGIKREKPGSRVIAWGEGTKKGDKAMRKVGQGGAGEKKAGGSRKEDELIYVRALDKYARRL